MGSAGQHAAGDGEVLVRRFPPHARGRGRGRTGAGPRGGNTPSGRRRLGTPRAFPAGLGFARRQLGAAHGAGGPDPEPGRDAAVVVPVRAGQAHDGVRRGDLLRAHRADRPGHPRGRPHRRRRRLRAAGARGGGGTRTRRVVDGEGLLVDVVHHQRVPPKNRREEVPRRDPVATVVHDSDPCRRRLRCCVCVSLSLCTLLAMVAVVVFTRFLCPALRLLNRSSNRFGLLWLPRQGSSRFVDGAVTGTGMADKITLRSSSSIVWRSLVGVAILEFPIRRNSVGCQKERPDPTDGDDIYRHLRMSRESRRRASVNCMKRCWVLGLNLLLRNC